MSWMLLIIEPEGQRAGRTEAEGREAYAAMQRFGEGLRASGRLRAVESLASTRQAVRVSRAPGMASRIDGPFAEAKEMVGGFFLLDGVTRDEAIELARQFPASQWATVEVRPLAPCFDDRLATG